MLKIQYSMAVIKEVEIEKGRFYRVEPTHLPDGIFKVININHHSKTAQIQSVVTGDTTWTKVRNFREELQESDVTLEMI